MKIEDRFLYDLTDSKSALASLSKFINVSECDVLLFLTKNISDKIDYDREIQSAMLEQFHIEIDNLNIDDLEIKSIHVTTGNDDGKSILENGLLNLKNTIKKNTPMRRFLIDKEIEIAVEKQLVIYKGKNISITDDVHKHIGERNLVYHKLYRDYLINGFHCDENPIKYDGYVAYRPEFIKNLGKMLRNNMLEYDWMKKFKQCYIIEYKANPYKYEWFNYQIDDMTEHNFNLDKPYYIKKWLLRQSINVILKKILGDKKPQIYSYLNFNENIPSKDIISVIDVTKERAEIFR